MDLALSQKQSVAYHITISIQLGITLTSCEGRRAVLFSYYFVLLAITHPSFDYEQLIRQQKAFGARLNEDIMEIQMVNMEPFHGKDRRKSTQ